MTCALLHRSAGEAPTRHLATSWQRLVDRLSRDDGTAQFARFVTVGGISSALYGVLFVLLQGLGHQPANLVGAVASSMLANELHRRLTFHAGERVSWFTAQWEGGGLAVAGMVATALALAWFDAVTDDAGTLARLAVVAAVTGAIGLLRFVALRWVFGARTPDRA
ncbi:GtrA family protein [Geodermatophilus sp. SYSU D00691]